MKRDDHLTIFCIDYNFSNRVAFAAIVGKKFAAVNVKNYALKEYLIAFQLYHLAFLEAVTKCYLIKKQSEITLSNLSLTSKINFFYI